jgi:hypothetical protein
MIPEEDRGPAWLRDYGFTDFGDIAADIHAMAEYAKKLAADVEGNYMPHSNGVSTAFGVTLPTPNSEFHELCAFMKAHDAVREITKDNVAAFGRGSSVLANAAQQISDDYGKSDAFAHATVRDVDKAFTDAALPTSEGDI